MTSAGKRRRKKKKGSSARKREVKVVKKLSRKTRVPPTRAHQESRRRQSPRTKDLLEETAEENGEGD